MTKDDMRQIDTLVVHCSATPSTMDVGVSEIRKWHVEERGWSDIGYHAVIRRDGLVQLGRPIPRPGAHVKGHNQNTVGVCLVGGVDSKGKPANNFTEQQLYSLYQYVRALELTLGHEVAVVGHRDLDPGKACPSFEVRNWVEQWRPLSSSAPLPGQQTSGRPGPEPSTDSS